MDENLSTRLNSTLERLSSTYKISVTEQASVIIGDALQAIKDDPHRSWPANIKKDTSAFQDSMLEALPAALASFALMHGLNQISSFDLLHAMSNIVDSLCPFVKPPA